MNIDVVPEIVDKCFELFKGIKRLSSYTILMYLKHFEAFIDEFLNYIYSSNWCLTDMLLYYSLIGYSSIILYYTLLYYNEHHKKYVYILLADT